MDKRPGWRQAAAGTVGTVLVVALPAAVVAPPDLRLEWVEAGHTTREAAPVSGRPGETLRLPYQIRNVGGSDAFAVIVAAYTTLGPLGQAERLQPGPRAGQDTPRQLTLPLARGMREVCLDVHLQTLNVSDPQDPNPSDNRLCRRVDVTPGDEAVITPAELEDQQS
jgi:hypothetical protein